jgi:hypothetical protein
MAKSIAQKLRKEVESNTTPKKGTVVVFTYVQYPDQKKRKNQGRFECVAVATGSLVWQLTDERGGAISRSQNHVDFVRLLGGPNVRKAAVVTKTERFKP